MPSCCVDYCCNTYRNSMLMMVRFPKDEVRRQKWLDFVEKDLDLTRDYRICEVHFDDDQWIRKSVRLKPDAVPTIKCVTYCPHFVVKIEPGVENNEENSRDWMCGEQKIINNHEHNCIIRNKPETVFPENKFFSETQMRQIKKKISKTKKKKKNYSGFEVHLDKSWYNKDKKDTTVKCDSEPNFGIDFEFRQVVADNQINREHSYARTKIKNIIDPIKTD